MKLLTVAVMVVCVTACVAQKIELPKLTPEERKYVAANMETVVDCIMDPKPDCHPYTVDVNRHAVDLYLNQFKCNCDSQADVEFFRRELNRNGRALQRLIIWINDKVQHL